MKAIIYEDEDSSFEFIIEPPSDIIKFEKELWKALSGEVYLPDNGNNKRLESKARICDLDKLYGAKLYKPG